MRIPDRARQALWVAWPALAAVLAYRTFVAIGRMWLRSYRLDLGSQALPNSREAYFVLVWGFFGTIGAALLALSLARLASRSARVERALRLFPETEDAAWVAFLALAAFLLPFVIRSLLLDGAAVADDESCYHYGAELVASGRLTAPSPPMKLFFDRTFMINDGHLYPMYFMGWPILMAPGVKLGVAGFMNAFYAALTVPALFLATRRMAGSTAARVCALLFVASPMLMIAAATEMSNTTCFAALAWMLASYVEARDDARGSLLPHAGVALFFGLAVLIRPPSAIGTGLPVLVAWGTGVLRGRREARIARLVAFAVPAAAMGALFFAINKIQNGSFLLISYIREFDYAKENGFRFNNWGVPGMRPKDTAIQPHFAHFPSLDRILGIGGAALLRLNYNLFGWVPSLLFVPLAWRRDTCLLFAMVGCYFLTHYGIDQAGIDIYGPHHYVEVTLPLVILSAIGAVSSARWLRERVTPHVARWKPELLPGALAVALVTFTLVGYDPLRANALLGLARDVNYARDTLAEHNVHNAVVFSPRPFTAHFAQCREPFAEHFVYWHPNNDPDLKNDVLWVNHVSLAEDAKLMASLFPDRKAYVYFFAENCDRIIAPLDALQPGSIPDGDVDGDNRGVVGAHLAPRAPVK